MEPNCVSYNFDEKEDTNGQNKCDLNNATYEHDNEHSGDLAKSESYVYRGAENACSKKPCQNNATCQAGFTDRDYQCLCIPGFTGHDCENDIDECTDGTHKCDVNGAVCNNIQGSYNCTCKDAFYGDGIICTDIDECASSFKECKDGLEENCTVVSVPGPVALYPLNSEYQTREANNRQPMGTTGTDVSLVPGPDGEPLGSYLFSGQDESYIEFPNNGRLNVKHSITMLCWVYMDTTNVSGPIFSYNNNQPWGIRLRVNSGKLRTRFKQNTHLTTVLPLEPKLWHYVGSSYNHETGKASLWLNGTKVEEGDIRAGITLATEQIVRMGATAKSGKKRFKGRITAMRVYNVALTAGQINKVKHAGRGRN